MPELPEIEHLRCTLKPSVIGARVVAVRVHRTDVIRRAADGPGRTGLRRRPPASTLLEGSTIVDVQRHGKQLALIADSGAAVCIHLGMSGQLRYVSTAEAQQPGDHVHVRWSMHRNGAAGELVFRDPRRFGGVWTARSIDELVQHCWCHLGPDALTIAADELHASLRRTSRPIKAALLDQRVVAGLGNIYVDESLFLASINPQACASRLSGARTHRLHDATGRVLRRAITNGGSTLRDYVDANGTAGKYAALHNVYGRAGQPCTRCGGKLVQLSVAQRTTVYCSRCQRR